MNSLLLVGLLLGGGLLGGVWIRRRRQERQRQLWLDCLPDLLDLIVMCLDAGLSFPRAWSRCGTEAARRSPSLAAWLVVVGREMERGVAPAQALENLAERLQLEEYREFARLLGHTQRYGVGVSGALRQLIETLRERAFQRAERYARQANVQMLCPTILCLFPAMLIVLLGPAAVRVYEVVRQARGG
ncbi:MAG: type II secretion system F family protein [Planctomycetota bacterium]